MTFPEELKQVFNPIENEQQTEDDLNILRQWLQRSDRDTLVQQLGKYNIIIGEGKKIEIGNQTYYNGWNDEALKALMEQYRMNLTEGCRDRDTLDRYLEGVLKKLKQQGCSDIRKDFVLGSRTFNYIAKMSEFELPLIAGFELPFGVFNNRGTTFFMFSEFASLQMETLQQFSSQCFQWAKEEVKLSTTIEAIYNGRVPCHICFAAAIVDELDEKTRITMRKTNPLNNKADALWYQVPVVYELGQQQLHIYEQSDNPLEAFIGKATWDSLRQAGQKYLIPS